MPAWKCCNPRYIKNELNFCGGLTVQLVYAAQQFHNVQQPVVVCSFSGDSDSNALKSLQYLSKSPILPVFIALYMLLLPAVSLRCTVTGTQFI